MTAKLYGLRILNLLVLGTFWVCYSLCWVCYFPFGLLAFLSATLDDVKEHLECRISATKEVLEVFQKVEQNKKETLQK